MVTDMVILTEPTIMERGALMLNLMVTTAMGMGKRSNDARFIKFHIKNSSNTVRTVFTTKLNETDLTINSLIAAVFKY